MNKKVIALASRIVIGSVPFTIVAVHAQTPGPASQDDAAKQNEAVMRIWQQQSGSTVALTPNGDGGTKVEFRGGVSADYYHNKIETPAGASTIISPLQTGSFFKIMGQGDVRATSEQGAITYAQGTVTASDDRAVISRYSTQLTNFQMGRVDKDYQMTLGDVAVNYSQLSSSLGMRGFSGLKQFDTYTISGHIGVVTETWESLMNKDTLDGLPARTRYTRDVYGLKLENAFTQNLKAYITTQRYNDQEGSLLVGSFGILPSNVRSATTGFTYQEGRFALNGETAVSRYGEKDQDTRKGNATIFDTTYRLDNIGVRAGLHNVSPSFGTLSQAVPPGIKESYVGADWSTTSWLTVGTEYRDSKRTTPTYKVVTIPPVLTPIIGTATSTQALTSRVNLTFGPNLPGWGMAFQDTHTHGTDVQGLSTPSSNFMSSLSYSSQTWYGTLSAGNGRVQNAANPQADSTNQTGQLQFGRQISNGTAETAATWTANASIMAGQQRQDLINLGTSTTMTNYGLVFALQRVNSLQLSSSIVESRTTQTTGGPELTSLSLQLECAYPFGQAAMAGATLPGMLKFYVRDNKHNIGDPNLRGRESVVGMQGVYTW